MSERSPLYQQIDTLPQLIRDIVGPFDASARATFDFETCTSIKRVYLVGCGDSYHASYGAELAFHQLAGVSAQALSSLTFSRYHVGYLPPTGPQTNLVIAVSVSGVVTRTIEALLLAQQAGAIGVALTGNPNAPLAQTGQKVFVSTVPPLPDEMRGMVVPGVRSYLASQIALYSAALRIGEVRGHLTTARADSLRRELGDLAQAVEATIAACEPVAKEIAASWGEATPDMVFVGGGPLYGAAMFSAAKLLEGSGDNAFAQETEEWAHLQYFAEPADSPTFLLEAGGFAADRMEEIARAAHVIGRQVIAITAQGEQAIRHYASHVLPVAGDVRECFAPLVYSIPGELVAAARAEILGTPYFRNFGGGRTVDWADGSSRIRDSQMLREIRR